MKVEWYTPIDIIEAARATMGNIDLDPASCEEANLAVKATRFISQSENSLKQKWNGRVFLNPPFSLSRKFVPKLLLESDIGRVSEFALLVPINSYASWFIECASRKLPICMVSRKVEFRGPNNKSTGSMWPICVFYKGPNENRFSEAFDKIGPIYW